MQPIEKALSIVATQGVVDNYVYPAGEMLNDDFDSGNTFRNPYFGDTPSPVKFMCGTQKELNVWLKDTNDKYPVIWLVYPVVESYNNNPQDFYTYKGTRLIFAINNNAEAVVNVRLQTTKFVLNQLVDKFMELMRNSQYRKFLTLDKQVDVKETFFPNYSTDGKQTTGGNTEIWDAIAVDCDLHLISKCIPKN